MASSRVTGLHGASTDSIARLAGISQPYLFRLFGSKKELFLAVNDACFAETLDVFREAASGKSGEDALRAIGDAYRGLIESDRTMLQGQLQSYAASVEEEDVRESTARGYGRLVDYVETVSGADRQTIAHVLRHRHADERACGDGVLDRRRSARLVGRPPRGGLRARRSRGLFFSCPV